MTDPRDVDALVERLQCHADIMTRDKGKWVRFIDAADCVEAATTITALQAEVAALREALKQAKADLLAVGNDYPGSSCQKWCTERAALAWNVLEPWKHCPSTHCERAQECRSINECSAARAALGQQP